MAQAYYALTRIFHNDRLAYNVGDRVPDANVTLHGYGPELVELRTVPDPAPGQVSPAALFAPAHPAISLTRNPNGTIESQTVNGVATTYTYNADGTVATATRLGVVRTFTYSNGELTGIN